MKLESKQLEEFRAARGRRNITIKTLAKEVGVRRYTISNIINGKTDGLNKDTLNKVIAWIMHLGGSKVINK